ncbi:MAG: cob(I)yrinic acid a,c-diamide adenosyltransferase [Kiritimatiellae bacterium]|nr:cob(I)yrinic acid a,c-diamide adenosyltransferase [Kiritimatiellia bacterium]
MHKGLIQIYTGAGKGKTTAALGLALRAAGAGLKVYLGQFIKKGGYSEIKALRWFRPKITVCQYGAGCFVKGKPLPADIQRARNGLDKIAAALQSGKYDVVIADEFFCALKAGLFTKKDALALMDKKTSAVELVLTGRDAPREMMQRADLVTEMKKIRHPFDCGITARKGIEF